MAAHSRTVEDVTRKRTKTLRWLILGSLLAVHTQWTRTAAQAASGGALAAGQVRELVVTGQHGVPADVKAVALNITAVNPSGPGFVTAYPYGSTVPTTSTLNYAAGQTVPNLAVVRPGDGGKVCFFTSSTADIIVDVQGYFPASSSIDLLPSPERVLSTRDGIAAPKGKVRGGTVFELPLGAPSRGSSPYTFGSVSAILNVTVTNPAGAGYLTIYPCGVATPNTSNLNFTAGQTVANLTLAWPGELGRVCVFTSETTDVLADLSGWTGSNYTPFYPPFRNMSTRDGEDAPKAKVLPGSTTHLLVTPQAPNALNVTVTNPDSAGFVTVFPCGQPTPIASNMNFEAGQTVASAVLGSPGAIQEICFYSSAATDISVDTMGYWYGDYLALAAPVRVLDTRTARTSFIARRTRFFREIEPCGLG